MYLYHLPILQFTPPIRAETKALEIFLFLCPSIHSAHTSGDYIALSIRHATDLQFTPPIRAETDHKRCILYQGDPSIHSAHTSGDIHFVDQRWRTNAFNSLRPYERRRPPVVVNIYFVILQFTPPIRAETIPPLKYS